MCGGWVLGAGEVKVICVNCVAVVVFPVTVLLPAGNRNLWCAQTEVVANRRSSHTQN